MDEKLNESTLETKHDLNLSAILFPNFQKAFVVPEELNNYLRDQLEEMKCENQSLQQTLLQKDLQLREAQIKIQDLTEKYPNSGNVPLPQIAHRKIEELSKKLREKYSEIEVFKLKCAKLENSLLQIQEENENREETDRETVVDNEHEVVIKKLQDKLTLTKNKWIEEKNLNLQLKNDLRMANKWLQQEVGDKFETLLVLNSSSNWRGRAQIICDLQQKNQELKEKLKIQEENKNEKCPQSNNQNHQKYIEKIEELNKENSELKKNHDELKRKFSFLKSRSRILTNDQNQLKSKLTELADVHEADQRLIAELNSQVSHFNEIRDEKVKEKDEIIRKLQKEIQTMKEELSRAKCLSENRTRDLLEKNDDISMLPRKLGSSRPTSSYMHKNNIDGKIINKLEVERLRLLELSEIQNARLQEERNSHLKTQQLLRAEKQKCTKLEARVARLHLEQTSSCSSYRNSTTEPKEDDLKDKLELAEENIKALNTRLEIESFERKRDLQQFHRILNSCI